MWRLWAAIESAGHGLGTPARERAESNVLKRCHKTKNFRWPIVAPYEYQYSFSCRDYSKGFVIEHIDALVTVAIPTTGIEVAFNERYGL